MNLLIFICLTFRGVCYTGKTSEYITNTQPVKLTNIYIYISVNRGLNYLKNRKITCLKLY